MSNPIPPLNLNKLGEVDMTSLPPGIDKNSTVGKLAHFIVSYGHEQLYSSDNIVDLFLEKFSKDDKFFDYCLEKLPTFKIASAYTHFSTPLETVFNSKNVDKIGKAINRLKEINELKEGSRPLYLLDQCCDLLKNTSEVSDREKLTKLIQELDTIVKNQSPHFLDKHSLVGSDNVRDRQSKIKEHHREWYLQQAILRDMMKKLPPTEEATRRQLALLILQAYSKAAQIVPQQSEAIEIQTTPLSPFETVYHRSAHNPELEYLESCYKDTMAMPPGGRSAYDHYHLFLIHSPLIREVLARDFFHEGLPPQIDTLEEQEKVLDILFANAEKGVFPEGNVVFDFSKLLAATPTKQIGDLKNISDVFFSRYDEKVRELLNRQSNFSIDRLNQLKDSIFPIALTEHLGEHILLCDSSPSFGGSFNLRSFNLHRMHEVLDKLITVYGFNLSPDQAKNALLNTQELDEILKKKGLPLATLGTAGTSIPTVCQSWNHFLEQKLLDKFAGLSSDKNAAPYLQVLPIATVALLRGLADSKPDQVFQEKGLHDLLQFSYIRMSNAMNSAILYKDDLFAFQNEIDVIHQEIQNILSIVAPYGETALAEAVTHKLTKGEQAILPENLSTPVVVTLQPSGMHGVASVLASVEAQKGHNNLHIALQKNSYYEIHKSVEEAKTYHLYTLDGEKMREGSSVDTALNTKPQQPIDLFLCELHHNISLDLKEYHPEDIISQIKGIVDSGNAATPLTVMIDTTINLEDSDELRALFSDVKIREWLESGKINIVLLRSTQKFDMLGIDNYYGGLVASVNKGGKDFAAFNDRIATPEDQLRGINYQGITHLQKCGGGYLDAYRRGIMDNTQKLYGKLPPAIIYSENSQNPVQVSRIDSKTSCFLDIKFQEFLKTQKAFREALTRFLIAKELSVTSRPSFGFANTNMIVVKDANLIKFRITPGLENESFLDEFAKFFVAVQQVIDECARQNLPPEQLDTLLDVELEKLFVTAP